MNNLYVEPGKYTASAWFALSAYDIKEFKHHINVLDNGDVFEYATTNIHGDFFKFETPRKWKPHTLIHYTLTKIK